MQSQRFAPTREPPLGWGSIRIHDEISGFNERTAAPGAFTLDVQDRDPERPDDEQRLTRSLGALFHGAEPPDRVRDALREAARQRANEATTTRPWPLRVLPFTAAAAAASAALYFAFDPERAAAPETTTTGRGFARADVDRSGRVDIWDAYLIASAVDGQSDFRARFDLDRDGSLTYDDVDLAARGAVEVPR